MTTLLWIIALVLMALLANFATRLRAVEGLHRPAQAALLLATGTVIGSVILFIESTIGIPWNRVTILIPFIAAAALIRMPSSSATPARPWGGPAIITLLLAYAVISGRATSPDLLYFWGPKGVHFFRVGRIDAAFLSAPEHLLMHSDYPPLLPLVYAFASTLVHGFSWWGAIFTAVLYFTATIALFHGLAARSLDSRATLYTTLLAAMLAFGYVHTGAAGGAEPLLILFEVAALSLLTFAADIPGATLLGSIALLGAVLTKVEGAIFAAAVVIAFVLTRRTARRVLQLAAPAAVGLGAWVLFAAHFGLLDSYRSKPLFPSQTTNVFTAMLRMASYRAAYVPWIACIAPVLAGRAWKRAALPLLVAGLFSAGLFFVYLHSPDPGGWINTSAERVLLSTLVALLVAASASSPLLAD